MKKEITNESFVKYFVHEAIRYFERKYGWELDLKDIELIELIDSISEKFIELGGMTLETPDLYISDFTKNYVLEEFPYLRSKGVKE